MRTQVKPCLEKLQADTDSDVRYFANEAMASLTASGIMWNSKLNKLKLNTLLSLYFLFSFSVSLSLFPPTPLFLSLCFSPSLSFTLTLFQSFSFFKQTRKQSSLIISFSIEELYSHVVYAKFILFITSMIWNKTNK